MKITQKNKTQIKNFAFSAKKILCSCTDEETAFIWFSRITAVHYMKINGYIPEKLVGLGFDSLCRALSAYLPEFFYETKAAHSSDAIPLDHIMREISKIDNDVFIENPEVIGEIYQHYISDQKEQAFLLLQKNIRITKENLPAATQIFTPRWLVRYLVENSLGVLLGETESFDFYIKEQGSLNAGFDPAKIKLIDPCMGTANMLLCAFDVLMEAYKKQSIPSRDAAGLILRNNLFGIDIDEKVYRLAYFALMMKARCHDPDIFEKEVKHNLCVLQEDDGIFHNAKLYGSLIKVKQVPKNHPLARQAKIMSDKYDVVITNPPYMGKKSLCKELSEFLDNYYPCGKSELYSAFIVSCVQMLKEGGICAMVTIHSWMFISSFARLREFVLQNTAILSLVHTGAATFEELNSHNALATAFCLKKGKPCRPSVFIRLTRYLKPELKIKNFHNPSNKFIIDQNEFNKIPKKAFIYGLGEDMRRAFWENIPLGQYCRPRQGIATGDNKSFVYRWYQVPPGSIAFGCRSIEEFHATGKQYAPYNKGGNFRKWYGNNEFVIKFDKESFEKLAVQGNKLPSRQYYFKEGITWSLFGFENFSVRCKPCGFVFDVAGSSLFPRENIKYILAFLSSKIAFEFLSAIAPTVNFQVGDIASLPLKIDEGYKSEIEHLADENIKISKEDWDSFELSWDFKVHPLAVPGRLSENFEAWSDAALKRYNTLKSNEERLNQIFAEIYGISVPPRVDSRDIAIATADLNRDIKSFVSYVVGCIFGRYAEGGHDLLSVQEITKLFTGYVEENLGYSGENLDFIAKALGYKTKKPEVAILNYLSKRFFKDHYAAYKKCPIYQQICTGGFNGFLYIHNMKT
jgi:hypothetical protein